MAVIGGRCCSARPSIRYRHDCPRPGGGGGARSAGGVGETLSYSCGNRGVPSHLSVLNSAPSEHGTSLQPPNGDKRSAVRREFEHLRCAGHHGPLHEGMPEKGVVLERSLVRHQPHQSKDKDRNGVSTEPFFIFNDRILLCLAPRSRARGPISPICRSVLPGSKGRGRSRRRRPSHGRGRDTPRS